MGEAGRTSPSLKIELISHGVVSTAAWMLAARLDWLPVNVVCTNRGALEWAGTEGLAANGTCQKTATAPPPPPLASDWFSVNAQLVSRGDASAMATAPPREPA